MSNYFTYRFLTMDGPAKVGSALLISARLGCFKVLWTPLLLLFGIAGNALSALFRIRIRDKIESRRPCKQKE
jgi:hypothetical protein